MRKSGCFPSRCRPTSFSTIYQTKIKWIAFLVQYQMRLDIFAIVKLYDLIELYKLWYVAVQLQIRCVQKFVWICVFILLIQKFFFPCNDLFFRGMLGNIRKCLVEMSTKKHWNGISKWPWFDIFWTRKEEWETMV